MENRSQLIERYLLKEMDAAEKAAFEKDLSTDSSLRQELQAQKEVVLAAERAGLKAEFGSAIRKTIRYRKSIGWGIAGFIAIIGLIIFIILVNRGDHREKTDQTEDATVERFRIKSTTDTIIETREGAIFAIPAGAFDTDAEEVALEIRTALKPEQIIRQGLSTTSNGELLQTAGMFYLNVKEKNKSVGIVKNISVNIPAVELNPKMQVFDGMMDDSGNINWIDPKPIEKKLRTYDIRSLDFYPPGFIPTLKSLQKNYRDKRYTDSLYYSFSNYRQSPLVSTDIMTERTFRDNSIRFAQAIHDSLPPAARDTSIMYQFEIDPSRIRAIWDTRFNNTFIATKEFEERLRFMHGLCTEDFLDIYLERLNQPLYEIDAYCASISKGSTKNMFEHFAERKDGRVPIASGVQDKLSAYVQGKYKSYKEAAESTWQKYQSELRELSTVAETERREQMQREFLRTNENFEKEYCINLTEAYRQIGIVRSCDDTIPPPPPATYYEIEINTTGWKNLDVYVFDATLNRQSMEYVDPESGKTARLTYAETKVQVENIEQYDRVLVYLVPDSLNSFQRMKREGLVFKENLNSLFTYDAVAVAYKGQQSYYFRQKGVKSQEYTFRLAPISETELKGQLNSFSKEKAWSITEDLRYQVFEQQYMMKQLEHQKSERFREIIARSIFNCLESDRGMIESVR
ncbi:MAG: hypothetical protein H7Y42_08725 [Chitinophagaceae bacterium]|nr:hypothetical protein [Chitinophagaceae bacterium]